MRRVATRDAEAFLSGKGTALPWEEDGLSSLFISASISAMRAFGAPSKMALKRGRGIKTIEAACCWLIWPSGVVVVVGRVVLVFPEVPMITRWKSCVSVFETLVASAYSSGTSWICTSAPAPSLRM